MTQELDPIDEQPSIGAVVNVDRVSDGERHGRVARAWIDAATNVLFPEMWKRLQTRGNTLDSGIVLTPYADGPIKGWKFSPKRWSEAVAFLDRHPETIGLVATDKSGVSVGAHVAYDAERGLRLSASVSAPQDDVMHTRWMDFLPLALKEADPVYGEANVFGAPQRETHLDRALRRQYDESVSQARDLLRGYGWVTIVPRELVQKLGGLQYIVDRGAAAEVVPLASGACVVRATAHAFEFDDTALLCIFRLLAPVLPSGQPRPDPFRDLRVVFEDAQYVS